MERLKIALEKNTLITPAGINSYKCTLNTSFLTFRINLDQLC